MYEGGKKINMCEDIFREGNPLDALLSAGDSLDQVVLSTKCDKQLCEKKKLYVLGRLAITVWRILSVNWGGKGASPLKDSYFCYQNAIFSPFWSILSLTWSIFKLI